MPQHQADVERQGASVYLDESRFAELYESWKTAIGSAIQSDERWALVGVKRRGAVIARRLWEALHADFPKLDYGEVDISLYRDDYHLQLNQPRVLGTEIGFDVDQCRILLVDDVLFTGRTIRAALGLILDFGRPRRVLLAVVVDRGHRELPIAADFVGIEIETAAEDRVRVQLSEFDGADRVLLARAST